MTPRRRARGRRGDGFEDHFDRDGEVGPEETELDLHGLRPSDALQRLALAVHSSRVRGAETLLVVTGRGWGNDRNEPVLRTHVENWTRTTDARDRGVLGFARAEKGGALRLRLKGRS